MTPEDKQEATLLPQETTIAGTDLFSLSPEQKQLLKAESEQLLAQLVAEQDSEKVKDLTYLFNQNQNKKTMIRQDQLNVLQDLLVDQAVRRITARPDEISNETLLTALKTVQDMLERSQKSVNGTLEQPLIQINQQNNGLNVGTEVAIDSLQTKESRERVKNFVTAAMAMLNNTATQGADAVKAPVVPETNSSEEPHD